MLPDSINTSLTKEQIEKAIKKATKGASDLLKVEIIEDKQTISCQIGPGKPGPNTQYREVEKISYRLKWEADHKAIRGLAVRDGIFPLITNSDINASEVLKAYKNQPSLEKRMYTLKSILNIAPVFLKKPKRIEAMTFLYFIALMIVSLMERNIRKNMVQEKFEKLAILPNGMKTSKPTWNNIKYFYDSIHFTIVKKQGSVIQTILKGVTKLHETVIKLLGIPTEAYTKLQDRWWIFSPSIVPQTARST